MSSLDYLNDDIDPVILADVARVVQELMRMQQLEQEQNEGLQQQQQQQWHLAKHTEYHHNYDHHHNPTPSREVHCQDSLEYVDRMDIDVPILSIQEQDQVDETNIQTTHLENQLQGDIARVNINSYENNDRPSLLPSSSTSSSLSSDSSESSESSVSSYNTAPIIPSHASSAATTPLPPFQLNGSPFPHHEQTTSKGPQSAILVPSTSSAAVTLPKDDSDDGNVSDQVLITLLPGQNTPIRATASVKGPSNTPDEPDHQYFEHAPDGKDLFDAKIYHAKDTAAAVTAAEAAPVAQAPQTSAAVIPRSMPQLPSRHRRKKALLIGINYFGDPNQLLGCINDTRDVFGFLNGYFGFRYQDTIMLTDDQIYEDKRPTGANIRYWMKWLVKDAEPQDSLFFHYAGHGGRIKDFSYNGKAEHLGDEADGYDEIIYPCDYLRSGIISDDEMYDLLVKELPAGVQLTALVDACHSGTMLDLPYIYNGNHVTALEKVTRTKVGAMAAMSASNVEFDLPGSSNSSIHTQTTTTTTTTTLTTVTMTNTTGAGESSPVVAQFTNGCAMTTDGHLLPPDGVPPIHSKEGASPLMSPGQTHSKRSITSTEDEICLDEGELANVENDDQIPALTITETNDSPSGDSALALSELVFELEAPSMLSVPTVTDTDEGGIKPSPRKRSSSVNNIVSLDEVTAYLETQEDSEVVNDHRGIGCDAKDWLEPISITSITATAGTVEVEFELEEQEDEEDEDDEEGMEEARRMAMFRKTKGNVVMFSGCRDDQASADIRASAKDAAIISNHHKALNATIAASTTTATTTNWGSPTAMNSQDDNMSNPLGYSLPQPYTSPMARGAVSYAWIQCLSQKPKQTYEELLKSMRYFMKQRDLEQIPQLGSGMPMDMRTVFTL